jgi:amino acid efflux transporter
MDEVVAQSFFSDMSRIALRDHGTRRARPSEQQRSSRDVEPNLLTLLYRENAPSVSILNPDTDHRRRLSEGSGRAEPAGSLRRVITVRHAVAIYISSVLGAGILVIPGLAARTAGAGSLLAWAFLSLASYPFALTFSSLSARSPKSGGIYSFAKEAFGQGVSAMTAWLFVGWVVLGAPAITLAAGTYLAYAFQISGPEVFAVAAGILVLAYAINLRGIRFSGSVQVAVVAAMLAILALAVVVSSPGIKVTNFSPLFPDGLASVGVASALIVWSYLGYENVSNIAGEFKNPERDFGRSVSISVVLISVLYMAVAFTVVGTGSYASGGGVTPFAEMMSNVFGRYGGFAVSLFAVVVIFSTVNAYTAGMGRVVYAAACDGNLPRYLAKVDPKTGVPQRALVALLLAIMLSLVVYYFAHVDIQSAFLATSGAAVLTYVVGSASGIKLLADRGARRALPWLSLIVSIVILPFIGPLLLASVPVAVLGFAYGRFRSK